MNISARNCLAGTVTSVKRGAVNSEVILALKGGASIAAVITNTSVDDLDLKQGREAFAIIRASSIIICGDMADIRTSARNLLSGKVVKLVEGPVSTEVGIDVGNGSTITAVITNESAKSLNLATGCSVGTLFKAPSVTLGVKE